MSLTTNQNKDKILRAALYCGTFACSFLPSKRNNTFHFYCCWFSCSCQLVKYSLSPWIRHNLFPLHFCRAIKYYVLLLIKISHKYYVCVSLFLSELSCMKTTYFRRLVLLSSAVCLWHIFPYYLKKLHDFLRNVIAQKVFWFSLQLFL
jgi:hypothetical protein